MAKERLVGSYLIRFTQSNGTQRVHVQDLRTREVLEFETWVAAWAFVDEAVHADAACDDTRS
ncbi:MAG: hypothetical protein EA416_07745 [Trueperaceae bacterium]|nr:MAG: hypothetical protein EA416_07745 [Trueperaceae bacterium]